MPSRRRSSRTAQDGTRDEDVTHTYVLGFDDPDFYADLVRAIGERLTLTRPGAYRGEIVGAQLGSVLVQRGSHNIPFVGHSVFAQGIATIAFQTDHRQPPVHVAGAEAPLGAMLLAPPDTEHWYRTSGPARIGTVSVPSAALAAATSALTGAPLESLRDRRLLRPPPGRLARLLDLHESVDGLARRAGPGGLHPDVARMLGHDILTAAVACLSPAAELRTPRPDGRSAAAMRRFRDILEQVGNRPLHLLELCALMGLPERTLLKYCNEHLGMSAKRFLWLRRMHLARRALSHAQGPGTTVTAVAHDFGFSELGRFAVRYRELFGETPRTTLHRALGGPAADTA